MFNNYLYLYSNKQIKAHPLSACKIEKIEINTTNNDLIGNQKKISTIVQSVLPICNQQPKVKKAATSVAAFSVRKNQIIGTTTNLNKYSRASFILRFLFQHIFKLATETFLTQKSKQTCVLNVGLKSYSIWVENSNAPDLHTQIFIFCKDKKNLNFFISYYLLIRIAR